MASVATDKAEVNSLQDEDKKQLVTDRLAKADDIPTKTSAVATTKLQSVERSLPVVYVPVNRSNAIKEVRAALPIIGEEAAIIEAIKENDAVIICGETGSGKTTQVPQFLYEAGFAVNGKLIGITEPRRIAAVSMSKRVAEELGVSEDICSYQIRFEGNVTPQTRIKFMTDGVLLREIKDDFLLMKYSVIIIDEAHERSVYSDILIGLLSRIVPLRQKRSCQPLKLVVMSATLRIDDFRQERLFKQQLPPLIHIASRQFPVTVYFNRTTSENYVETAYKKVCQIHKVSPADGGILVFVSGQSEVWQLITWLRKTFPFLKADDRQKCQQNYGEESECRPLISQKKRKRKERGKLKVSVAVRDFNLDSYKIFPNDKTEVPDFNELGTTEGYIDEELFMDETDPEMSDNTSAGPLYCLPLFSMLSAKKQQEVFQPPPLGARLCIIATNVAETSLTIPAIKYVVDTGKEKVREYDSVTGVSRFVVQWISKASANQRAGRAGRTGPGFCYRLYSSAVFNYDFAEYSSPEISIKPIDELVLQMKTMNVTHVDRFPFPTPPDPNAIRDAEGRLVKLGALEFASVDSDSVKPENVTRVTDLGQTLSQFPILPSYGKIIALSHQHGLLPYAICLVAALSVREPLGNLSFLGGVLKSNVDEVDNKAEKEEKFKRIGRLLGIRRQWAGKGQSLLLGDLSVLLKAVCAAEYENLSTSFCEDNGLRYKAMVEIRKMRRQLTSIFNTIFETDSANEKKTDESLNLKLLPPNDDQIRFLRQIVLSGLNENVARRCEEPKKKGVAYQRMDMEDPVYINPSSVLFKDQPEFVVYQEIIEGSKQKKLMFNVMAIELEWLPIYASPYCNFGPPLAAEYPARYCEKKDSVVCKVKTTFGAALWPLPIAEIEHPRDLNYLRLLAVEFLEGRLFNKLKDLRQHLLASPGVLMKEWSKRQPMVANLLATLAAEGIWSKKDFLRKWETNSEFLYREYSAWLPVNVQQRICGIWPPFD